MAFVSTADSANTTFTDNGAVTNARFGGGEWEGRVSLFFHAVRGMDLDRFKQILFESYNENKEDTWVLLFHLRDSRGGKGERDLFRVGLKYLLEKCRYSLSSMVFKCVEEYGRFDDLITVDSMLFYPMLFEQLQKDIHGMSEGKSVSLLAKWLPTENGKLDKKFQFVNKFCKYVGYSQKQYRRQLVSLRTYIGIVERLISSNRWTEVEYNKVPSCAMNKLKAAFEKHDVDGFKNYISDVKDRNDSINVGQLYPYQMVSQKWTEVVEVQWKAFLTKFGTTVSKWIPVCDVSSSMNRGTPKCINVCVSLGLFLALTNKGKYSNRIITFSEHPCWHIVDSDQTLEDQQSRLNKASWDMNTDLYEMFKLVLSIAKEGNLSLDEIPGLIIFSDMQFDEAVSNSASNFRAAKRLFKENGYNGLPKLIFWNLSSNCIDFPVTTDDADVCLVSGFSQSLFSSFVETGDLSPIGLVKNVLESNRYDKVRALLK